MKSWMSLAVMAFAACGGGSNDSSTDSSSDSDDSTTPDAASGVVCTAATTVLERAICQADGFLDSLSTAERTTANPAITDDAGRTKWSNLPTGMVARPGIQMGKLSTTQQAAALEMMATVLGDSSDLEGVRAADQYLNENGGGDGYGSGLYWVAVFGTPSTTDDWAIAFGGHHMAYNITFTGGEIYPTPNHLGVEPKAAFTVDGTSYQPLVGEGAAMAAVFAAFDSTKLSTSHLAGTYGDVLVGPVEYGSGSSAAAKAKYPMGANRTGVLVSALSTEQQALVTAAITQWVGDFDATVSAPLVSDYTSTAAYADTYVAWAGTGSAPDIDTSGTYFRIDGPRVWIEVACQGGIVIHNATHYHTIYRDKTFDYGGLL